MKLFTFCLLGASGLFASTLTVTGVDTTRGGSVSFLEDGVAVTDYAGIIFASYDNGPAKDFFCADLFTSITFATYDSIAYFLRVERNEPRVGYLFVNYLAGVTTPELGEGMQLAIWDILHDGGDGPTAGRVQSSVSTPVNVINNWNNYLAVSNGQSAYNASVYVNTLNFQPAQTLIGPLAANSVADVPEPATFALVGAAVFALGLRARRHKS